MLKVEPSFGYTNNCSIFLIETRIVGSNYNTTVSLQYKCIITEYTVIMRITAIIAPVISLM